MSTRIWDQAGSLPVPASGLATPEIVALRDEVPSVEELFTFMRDAELRFATLRMRIEEHSFTARGEDVVTSEVSLEHPGKAKVLSSLGKGDSAAVDYDVWISDGSTVRTYTASRTLGTTRPVRPRPRGLTTTFPVRRACTRRSRRSRWRPCPTCSSTRPGTARTCSRRATAGSPGRRRLPGARPSSSSATTRGPSRWPRTGRTSRSGSRSIALDGVILRLEESIGGRITRDAIVTTYART